MVTVKAQNLRYDFETIQIKRIEGVQLCCGCHCRSKGYNKLTLDELNS